MASQITWLATTGLRNTDGTVIASANLYFYVPGTTTQVAVYADALETSTLSQPVVTNAAGQATVFADGVVKLVAETSAGATVHSIERATATSASETEVESASFTGTLPDGSTGAGGKVASSTVMDRAIESFGAPDWQYLDSASGTPRAYNVVLRERGLSVKDRGAVGNGLTTDTTAFKSAIALLKSAGGGLLLIPPGTYLIDDDLLVDFNGLAIEGYGINVSILKTTSASDHLININGAYNFGASHLQLTGSGITSGCGVYSKGAGVLLHDVKVGPFFENCLKFDTGSFLVDVDHCNLQASAAGKQCVMITGNSYGVMVRGTYIEGASTGVGIGIEIESTANNISIHSNVFGECATGVLLDILASGTNFRLYDNKLNACTAAINLSPTTPYAAAFREWGNHYGTATITDTTIGSIYGSFSGGRQGNNITAAATISPRAGNFFVVAGNTNIDHIETLGRSAGDKITLQFSGSPTVNDNTAAAPAGFAAVQLTGAFVATANDSLILMYDGTDWKEDGRNVL